MQVANKELLHIHRQNYYQDQWKPGNILEFPKTEFNHYYKGLLTEPQSNVSANLQQYDLIEYLDKNLDGFESFNSEIDQQELGQDNVLNIKGFNSHIIKLLGQTFSSLLQSRKMLREVIFEDCRLKYFPNLPPGKSVSGFQKKSILKIGGQSLNILNTKRSTK